MTHLFAFNTGFKWFGSLTNLTFRRSSSDKSKSASKDAADQTAEEAEPPSSPSSPSTTDDMEVRPRLPSYVRSSDMYSHMGTMPRQLSKKKDKDKDKEKGNGKNSRKGKAQRGSELGRSQSLRPADHVCESPLMSMLSNQGRPGMRAEVASKPITTRGSSKRIEEEAEEVGAGKQPGDTVDGGVRFDVVGEPEVGLNKDKSVPVEESKVEQSPQAEGTAPPGGGLAERPKSPQSPTADMHQPPCQVVLPMKRGKRAKEQRDEDKQPEKKQSPGDKGPERGEVQPAPTQNDQQRETESR